MHKYLFILMFFLASMVFSTCAKEMPPVSPPGESPIPTPSKPEVRAEWEEHWTKTVALAKKEGKVFVYMSTGAAAGKETLIKNLREKYDISGEMMIGRGAELREKVFSERRAGLYIPDVYIGGITSIITELKPADVFDPLEQALILPEVRDPKKWYGGKLPFVDADRYALRIASYPRGSLAINTNLVEADEIKGYKDLLNPKWKGKILLNDPTITGAGGDFFYWVGAKIMGLDYMKEFTKQMPVITRDQRLQAEWVARGKYPLLVGPLEDPVMEMIKVGAPVKLMTYMAEGGFMQSGGNHVTLVNKTTRPNAARVLINWLLSKEGATAWSVAQGVPSLRMDVPMSHVDPLFIYDPAKKYLEEDEASVKEKGKSLEIAREIFGPLIQ